MKPTFALVAALMCGTISTQAAERRLNVLYIVSDDLNNTLGCYGAPVIRSPNIDRLAAHGVRFDRAYCNYPVCNPSRVSFLSGLRPDTTRIVDLATPTRTVIGDAVVMPELFRKSGYRTIKVGKIFHTGEGFEDPRSWDVDIRENKTSKNPPANQILRKQGGGGIVLRADDKDTWDGFVGRKAAEYLESVAKEGKPFFVAAGFRRPHTPYIAPEKYYAMYDPSKLAPRLGPPEHIANIPPISLTYNVGINPKFPEKNPGDTIAAYYAAISFMDAQVGILLDTMDRLKLWDNTIVVFHSDHGYHLGEHGGLWHKMSLFDECVRVPLIVAVPGKRPAVARGMVELVDMYQTLAALCGLKTPDNLEGTSFVPLLDHPGREWKRSIFSVVKRLSLPSEIVPWDPANLGRTVFDGRWRYTEWPGGGAELYDHSNDPFEYKNLANDPKAAKTRAEMKSRLVAGWKPELPSQ